MTLPDNTSGSAGGRPFTLHRDARERLVLVEADGRQHAGVEPVRSFPISGAGEWSAICEAQGHERACGEDAVRRLDARRVIIVDSGGIRYLIPDAAALDSASRRLLDRYV